MRSRTYVSTEQGTVAVQTGNPPKHLHNDANEIQYVVEGTGTAWFGDTQREIHPGTLMIIPKGTPHGGNVATSGRFKIIAIKLPPQAPTDLVLVK